MKKHIYIYGAGGLGREVLALINRIGGWEVKGFIDDHANSVVKDIPVIGGMKVIPGLKNAQVVIAVGDPKTKKKIAALIPDEMVCDPLVDPDARLLDPASVKLGKGSVIGAGTIITTEVEIGEHVLINLNCTIGHDCVIGSCSSIMPGANISGEVRVGECVLIGSGSSIRNQVEIGDNSVLGMGAVVLKDVAEGQMVVGVPARPKERSKT